MRRNVVARASISPKVHLFGDTLAAQLDLRVNRERIDPATVVVDAPFTPYRATDELRVTRTDVDGVTRLRYTAELRCLEEACVPPGLRRTYRVPQARISYTTRRGEKRTLRVRWPAISISSRLEQRDLTPRNPFTGPVLEARLPSPPEVTYRVRPVVAIVASLGLAALLAVAAAALILPALRRPEPEPAPEPPRLELPPLRRALVGLEWALRDGNVPEQRKALELLAEELETRDHRDLARSAGVLAWGPEPPRREAMTALCEQVRPHIESMPSPDGAAAT